jgi:hypothetical protein
MINKRMFLGCVAGLIAGAAANAALAAPAANDPAGIVDGIYARIIRGKGDGGGGFIMSDKAAKAKYFSKSVVTLWAKADAKTPKDDVGPIDFDLPTNSQDPSVKSYKLVTDKIDSSSATISVTMTGYGGAREKPSDDIVRYDFARDGGHWKIDDIRGTADGSPWSLRSLLNDSLKN